MRQLALSVIYFHVTMFTGGIFLENELLDPSKLNTHPSKAKQLEYKK